MPAIYDAWAFLDGLTAPEVVSFAKKVEAWGYRALWIPEAIGREPFAISAHVLANTTKLTMATGIANIYARGALTTRAAQETLNEQSGGRFLLGLGVSHIPLVEGVRKIAYGKPVASMRAYLEEMDAQAYQAPAPAQKPKRVLAALGPKMLELARTHADGAHPYNVTPEHTARARKILGPDKLLCVEQKVLLETDPAKARAIARQTLGIYLTLPNYTNNLKTLGFTDADCTDASDRLMDAMVAWGTESQIAARLKAHSDAGASHVCIQPLNPDGSPKPDERILKALAPAG